MKRILFVCKGNRFRSQIADAFFRKLNKNRKYISSSAGIIKGNPIGRNVRKTAHKCGLKLSKPKTMTEKTMNKQDIFVLVADNVPPIVFETERKHGKKLFWWKVKDVSGENIKGIEKTALIIRNKIKSFLKRLK